MYRLHSLRKIQIPQLSSMTLCNTDMNSKVNIRDRTYLWCKRWSSISKTFMRYHSTNINPNVKSPRKKRLRGVKKYAELLIITDKSTIEHRAKIKKLTSEDLNFLALTNLNLGELYKLKEMMKTNRTCEEHTYNNLAIIENMPAVLENTSSAIEEEPSKSVIIPICVTNNKESVSNNSESANVEHTVCSNKEYLEIDLKEHKENLIDSNILEEIEPLQDIMPIVNTFQPEIVEEESHEIIEGDIKNDRKRKNDIEFKQEVISRTLAAYIEMCGITNNINRGLNAIWAYKYRTRNPPLINVNVYNAALKGLASQGNLMKLLEIINYATSVQVSFNVQSYAAIFECLGRCNVENNHLKEIRIYGKEAIRKGFTFNRIINEGIFHNDEKEKVLKAMKAFDKNYIPNYIPPNVQYNNDLLNNLNNDKQLKYQKKKNKKDTGIFMEEKMIKMIEQQMEIERNGYVTVKNIENVNELTEDVLKYRKAFSEHIIMWENVASEAFNRDLGILSSKKHSFKLEPYLKSIPINDFINIIIKEAKLIAQGSETYSPTVNQLYRELGNKVYSRFKVLRKEKTGVLDKILRIHMRYCNDYLASHDKLNALPEHVENLNSRQIWQWIDFDEKPNSSSIELDHQAWVPSILQSVGKFLYNIVMCDLKIDANIMKGHKNKNYVPAFYTIFRHQGRIIKEEVKPHPVLSKLYRASAPETLTFPSYEVPMKCPPIPWSSLNIGGYLATYSEFVRLPSQALTQRQRLQESLLDQLYPSFDALNQLAVVPWKINRKILDCILKVFINGGSSRLSVPEHPSNLPIVVPPSGEMDKQQKYLFFRQKLQHRRKKAEMYSLWCDCLYKLSLANHFKDDVFWLPHNMDFRGRVYPVPPHLNHLGSDLARSMLVFAESRPLGPKGLDWLKLHLVNLTGLKKRESIEDRLVFANEIMDKIFDSADNPLTGNMWWASSDEPWQTLACCMEIAAAARSAEPENYRSHFPVHQDGSCNGLQHYAALGRDATGGYSVNLTPTLKPQDVYSAVAALVEERRNEDAKNGIEVATILKGFVKRKVIKQTVMTTVYGVTRFGARLQIARQLKDIDEFPKEHIWAASSYLTTRTFESLRTMFTSTREIQDWFTESAKLISSVCSENVEWVTPLGLPIVQPYSKYKPLSTNMFYELFHIDKYEKPNVLKQKNAFPPNFIHSLDSSHMMLTSLHCERAGITFVSVHDCYWTHPSTVHIMNKICREQFVALHSEPILENLSIFLTEKYSYSCEDIKCDGSAGELAKRKLNKVLRRLPRKGDLNINEVLNSVYFFS